jgi:glycosyl transferase family 1
MATHESTSPHSGPPLTKTKDTLAHEDLSAELAAVRASAHAMLESASWRATKPFRQIGGVLSFVRAFGALRTLRSILAREFTTQFHLNRQTAILDRSGLLDASWYVTRYPDVGRYDIRPVHHYLLFGASEGRDPSPRFDTSWYLEKYPDVAEARVNPFVHYLVRGAIEGRHPLPRHDTPAPPERRSDADVTPRPPVLRARPLSLPVDPKVSLHVRTDGSWLVCVSHVRPDPPRAGNAYRLRRLLAWAASEGYRVLLVHAPLADDEPSEDELGRLAGVYPDLIVCWRDGRIDYRLADAAAETAIAGLRGRTARAFHQDSRKAGDGRRATKLDAIERTFAHDSLVEVIVALNEVLRPSVVLVTYVFMTRFLPLLEADTLRVIDTIDVFSTRATKVERYGVPDVLALTAEEEASYLARADVVIAIQAEEARELGRLAPGARVVMAGVDFDVVPLEPARQGRVVLLIASDNAMNVKGAGDFLRFAWPLIRREVPEAEFWMAGKICRAVPSDGAGVKALGIVDDVDEPYRSARVTINPAVAGTGAKVKTLESLSRLRPVVCWPAGVAGLVPDVRKHCDVVENWYEFATRVIQRLQDDRSADALWAGRGRLAELFGAEAVYADLGDALCRRAGSGR